MIFRYFVETVKIESLQRGFWGSCGKLLSANLELKVIQTKICLTKAHFMSYRDCYSSKLEFLCAFSNTLAHQSNQILGRKFICSALSEFVPTALYKFQEYFSEFLHDASTTTYSTFPWRFVVYGKFLRRAGLHVYHHHSQAIFFMKSFQNSP